MQKGSGRLVNIVGGDEHRSVWLTEQKLETAQFNPQLLSLTAKALIG